MIFPYLTIRSLFVALAIALGAPVTMPAQQPYFTDWPAGLAPADVGKRLADHFVTSPHQYTATLHYSEVATWYGALTYARVSHDDALRAALVRRFDPLLPDGSDAKRIPTKAHVDDAIFGVVPLEIGMQLAGQPDEQKYLAQGKAFADRQWLAPRPDGLSNQTRFWIDDMYMLTILEVEAFRATRDPIYLDRAAREMVPYLDRLQQPNGLFFHAPDSPFYWGRGDGWVAAGMTELLTDLPEAHPARARILAGFRLMMASLLRFQGKDGMWRQILDHDDAWPETSSSAMFTFALVTGVKHGWLDPVGYGSAARRGWIAVAGYIDQNQDVTQVCEGTNKEHNLPYYLARKRRTGDFHGQAPMLWAATALLR